MGGCALEVLDGSHPLVSAFPEDRVMMANLLLIAYLQDFNFFLCR